MSRTRRLGVVLSVVWAAAGCGGRVIADGAEPVDETGADTAVTPDVIDYDLSFPDAVYPDAPWYPDVVYPDAPWTDVIYPDVIYPDTPWYDTYVWDTAPWVDSGVTDTLPWIDSGSGDTGLVDSGLVDSGIDGGTIAAICSSFADARCVSSTKTCCTSKGVPYDDMGCHDWANLYCGVGFDAVVAGKAKYDAAAMEACKSAWAGLETTCSIPMLTWLKGYSPCAHAFSGTVAPGGACTNAFECAIPSGYAYADCDATSQRCRTTEVVTTVGASCNYFGAAAKFCDYGLTCDYTSGGAPKCVKATPIGGACFGTGDTSCGLGNTCKAGKCAVGAPSGASCTYDLDCASWSCSVGKCTDPNFQMANKPFCSGG